MNRRVHAEWHAGGLPSGTGVPPSFSAAAAARRWPDWPLPQPALASSDSNAKQIPMKLFTLPGACSTADHIALQWTGKPFEVEVLTPAKIKSPDYLDLNPAGAVPALTHGDFVLTQNVAILNYVSDIYPEARLFGDGSPRQRAETTRWLMLCNADMQPVFGTFFAPTTYITDLAQHVALQQTSHSKLRRLFERADAQLEKQDWLAGFRSVADAYLFVMLLWAYNFDVDLDGLKNLVLFRKRMQADPGVRHALEAEGLV